MPWYFYIGIIASAIVAIYNIPQLIKVLKTKNTAGLSIIMLSLLILGSLFFVINGIGAIGNHESGAGIPVLLGNGFSFVISATILVLKIRSIYWSRKFNSTEKQFCDNYESFRIKIKMLKAEKATKKINDKVAGPSDSSSPSTSNI